MKKMQIIVLISFIFSNVLTFAGKYDKLKSRIIRIHVLANSDSKSDQILKYNVKNSVFEEVCKFIKNTQNKNQAREIILNNLDYISEIAKNKIIDNGYGYDVSVSFDKSYFPTRKYEGFTLPAGVYDALKIIIGKGQGKNWWCVAFPPMCSPIYSSQEKNEEILGSEQLELIQKPCEYKFAIVEMIFKLKQMFDFGNE